MGFDFGGILKFAFLGWYKEKWVLKYLAIFLILTGAITYSSLLLVGTINPQLAETNPMAYLSEFVSSFSLLMVISFVFGLVMSVFSYLLSVKALKMKKLGGAELTLVQWIKFVLAGIAVFFAALFSIFNLKLLWILACAVILFVLSIILFAIGGALAFVGVFFLVISFMLLVLYMLIFVYNSIRLSLTSLFIIQEERSFTDALKASWAASKGNVLNILIASLLVGIVIAIASWIASVPTVVYSVISALVLAVDGQSAVSSMTLISSPGYLLSMIPTVLVSAFASIASIFAEVAILAELTQKTKSRK